jgi:hypothetical protein
VASDDEAFVFVAGAPPQPVSYERDDFGFEFAAEAQASTVTPSDLSIDLGISLDEFGQIVFEDAYMV